MQLYYQPFYKLYGIRRMTQMLSPRLMSIPLLPRDSVVHYLSEDDHVKDLDVSLPYFTNMTKTVLVDYPEVLSVREGNPTALRTMLRPFLRDFHVKNKKFKYMPDAINRVEDPSTLFVFNYSYLNKLNRYQDLPLTEWYMFYNNYRTIFNNIAKISQTKTKHHFVFVDLPKELPSLSLLNMASNGISRTILGLFPDHSSLFMIEFWKWLGGVNRESTIFGDIAEEHLDKVNLVFNSDDGRSADINLAYLNSWLKGHENDEDVDIDDTRKLKPVELQKMFLKFAMTLKSRVPEEAIVQDIETAELEQGKVSGDQDDPEELRDIQQEERELLAERGDNEGDVIEEHEYRDLAPSELKKLKAQDPKQIMRRQEIIDRDIDKDQGAAFSIKERLKDIDKDIEILDQISSRRLKEKGIIVDKKGHQLDIPPPIEDIPIEVLTNQVYTNESIEDSLIRQINDQAEFGLITAADFKKMLGDVDKYKKSLDPYGTNQLTIEKSIVTPDDIQLDQNKTEISVGHDLTDKTMANSSLMSFDRDYINKVYQKDMLGMLGNLQKSGMIIRNHEVEEEHSALGSYENHSITLKPIDGRESTLRFRLPKVSEDGSFVSNSNKYQLRKQRVD